MKPQTVASRETQFVRTNERAPEPLGPILYKFIAQYTKRNLKKPENNSRENFWRTHICQDRKDGKKQHESQKEISQG